MKEVNGFERRGLRSWDLGVLGFRGFCFLEDAEAVGFRILRASDIEYRLVVRFPKPFA